MNLDISQWKEFKVSAILTIHNGKGITKEEIEDNEGDFTVVQSGEENNGVLGKISRNYCKKKNYTISERPCLTVARSGSAGYVSFQIGGCVVGDSAKILLLNENIASIELYVFLQTLLTSNRFKYAYGRKVTESKYMNDVIKLPIKHNEDGTPFIDASKKYCDEGYVPDWKYMENYIKSLHHKPLTTKNKKTYTQDLNVEEWQEFSISRTSTQSGLFEIENCKCGSAGNLDDGNDINYIGAKKNDNGVIRKVVRDESLVSKGNAIMFICDGEGSVGYTNYMDEDFIGSTTTSVGYDEALNPYVALFLVSVLDKEKFKFSYGRKYRAHINEVVIKLPIQKDINGHPIIDSSKKYSSNGYVPDWQFMKNYIKALPYGDRL
jgi:hypothetical protein